VSDETGRPGALAEVRVPDLGDVEEVDVVEVLVRPGDRVAEDDGLVTLESDKASMDVPTPIAGTVREVRVAVGGKVRQGDLLAVLEREAAAGPPAAEVEAPAPPAAAPAAARPRPGGALRTQVLVLGGGPGGYTAAFRAADLGLAVTLVEREPDLGGVCLLAGCIPSKALLHAARVLEEAAAFADRGIDFGAPRIDLSRLRSWKEGIVARSARNLASLARQRGVDVIHGTGRLGSAHELLVAAPGEERSVAFEQLIVAVGSRPSEIPGIPQEDPRVLDSTGALALADVPPRMLVVGGGIIGLEMATVYGALGSKLTIVELTPDLLPGCDRDLVRPLEKRLRERFGAEIHVATRVRGLRPRSEGLEAALEGEGAPATALFDRVLVAVGRRANGDAFGAEAAGLAVDERGCLATDRQQRTAVPHIFAIGDVVGQPMLAHKATHQGRVAAEACAGLPTSFDARVVPAVAYTDPEVAWVGLNETQASEAGIAYERASFPWAASGRAATLGRSDGATKLLVDPANGRLLGAGIVGPGAGELIAEAALAIEMDCEAADLALTIHPHPTLAETLGLAAEVHEGSITDLYRGPRRGGREVRPDRPAGGAAARASD
jgi:dihydrolipoamide dehydrogenase